MDGTFGIDHVSKFPFSAQNTAHAVLDGQSLLSKFALKLKSLK